MSTGVNRQEKGQNNSKTEKRLDFARKISSGTGVFVQVIFWKIFTS